MPQSARFARVPPASAPALAVTRQPILDASERVTAFQLLAEPAEALPQALAEIGLERLAGVRPAHIAVTRKLLVAVRPLPFPPERVVLELPADRPADDLLVAAAREARRSGFRIALDGFTGETGPLLALADAVKVGPDVEAATVMIARDHGLEVIAAGVDTRAGYGRCRKLGCEAFQGRYFAEPVVFTGAAVPTYRLRALALLARHDAVSFEQLERVISEDPGLALKLVKLANSAFFGGRHRVGSVRQALMALGSVAVRRWATLLVLAGATDRPTHLLELGLLRARLCELVAARTPDAEAERAFTAGLFSVVDSLLGVKMPTLLAELPFDERTARALDEHAGPEGRVLAGVLAYECGDFDGCARHGVSLVDIARAFAEALDWTDGAVAGLTGR
jgi:c-di-GMP phosphodiesterase